MAKRKNWTTNEEYMNQLDKCRTENRCYSIEPNNTASHFIMVCSQQTQGIDFFRCGEHGLEAGDIEIISHLSQGEWSVFPQFTVECIPNDNF